MLIKKQMNKTKKFKFTATTLMQITAHTIKNSFLKHMFIIKNYLTIKTLKDI